LLILEALGLKAPQYGHMSLIVGAEGGKLSKREGATSVRGYREQGYRPEALTNHLFRLGHSSPENGFLTLDEMARAFDPAHLGRAPARFDEQQLHVWQKEAAHRLSPAAALSWLGSIIPAGLDAAVVSAFLAAVMPNVVLPEDARQWADVVFGGPLTLAPHEDELIQKAGSGFFLAAADAAAASGNDWQAIFGAVRAATGKKGAELFMPLRAALTGRAHGPELAPLLKAMPPGKAHERLARFAR
jgi:glutamyl-tRNA synthetase